MFMLFVYACLFGAATVFAVAKGAAVVAVLLGLIAATCWYACLMWMLERFEEMSEEGRAWWALVGGLLCSGMAGWLLVDAPFMSVVPIVLATLLMEYAIKALQKQASRPRP